MISILSGEARQVMRAGSAIRVLDRAIGWLAVIENVADYSTNPTHHTSRSEPAMHRTHRPKSAYALALAALLAIGTLSARSADEVVERAHAAAGGARWDGVAAVTTTGTLATAGLEGRFEATEELLRGRNVTRFTLGPVRGAQGYDGSVGWSQDPGGEVAVQDGTAAQLRTRSEAWLAARGYWFPDSAPAAWGEAKRRTSDGTEYAVVEIVPASGAALELWFDAGTALPARAVLGRGSERLVFRYEDWRPIEGRMVPFRQISEREQDGSDRSVIEVTSVRFESRVDAALFAPPSVVPATEIASDDGVARVPVRLVNNHLLAEVSIDGHAATVIVDTGGANVLTPAAAQRIGLNAQGQLTGRGVGTNTVDVALAPARELRVGTMRYAKPTFYVMDLGRLDAHEGERIDGIVGYEIFQRFAVVIDYAGREVALIEPDRFVPSPAATVLPFRFNDRTPIIDGELDGLPVSISVDTGSRATFTVYGPFAREHDLAARYEAAPVSVSGWGVGGAAMGRAMLAGELRLGDQVLREIPASIFAGDRGAFARPGTGLNLGSGILRRYTVSFDYGKRRIYLEPNRHIDDAWPQDRTGLWLSQAEGALVVEAVAPESAAAAAGIVPGDRVVTIAGEAIRQRSLSDWRDWLGQQAVGTTFAIGIASANGTTERTLTLSERTAKPRRS
jgi:hypothetical protein